MIQIIPPQSGTFCLQNLKRPTKLYASFIVIRSTRYINLCLKRCPDMLHISRHLQTECQALNCFWGFPLNCLKYLCLSKMNLQLNMENGNCIIESLFLCIQSVSKY